MIVSSFAEVEEDEGLALGGLICDLESSACNSQPIDQHSSSLSHSQSILCKHTL